MKWSDESPRTLTLVIPEYLAVLKGAPNKRAQGSALLAALQERHREAHA